MLVVGRKVPKDKSDIGALFKPREMTESGAPYVKLHSPALQQVLQSHLA